MRMAGALEKMYRAWTYGECASCVGVVSVERIQFVGIGCRDRIS